MQLTIIDTKAGNFGSILNGFRKIGADIMLTDDADSIKNAEALVIPGVSAFARGMKGLHDAGLVDLVRKKIMTDKVPTFGICLGMQLLAKTGVEGSDQAIEGLGILDAEVVKLESKSSNYRVPNIGWYDVSCASMSSQRKLGSPEIPDQACAGPRSGIRDDSVLFPASYETQSFYHVHSYHMICNDPSDIAATIDYDDQKVTVAIEKDNVFGCQFHPEKSQDAGLDLLDRFVREAKTA